MADIKEPIKAYLEETLNRTSEGKWYIDLDGQAHLSVNKDIEPLLESAYELGCKESNSPDKVREILKREFQYCEPSDCNTLEEHIEYAVKEICGGKNESYRRTGKTKRTFPEIPHSRQ